MRPSLRSSLIACVFAVGCGADSRHGGGGDVATAGSAGTSAGTDSTGASGANGGRAAAGTGGSGTGGVGVATGSRVFSGTASMLFDGPSCTHEAGATGDRWCGFVALSSSDTRNLFVVNVSQVTSGVAVTCGVPDPNCLLLTPSLGGDDFDPTFHSTLFQGDTLIYYDDSLAPHVWRPGMMSGRLLASVSPTLDVIFCRAASQGTAVACLALPGAQPEEGLARGDLLLGKVDGEREPLLSAIDEVIIANVADRGGTARFGFGFPLVAGDYLAWTTRETKDGPEILKLQKADDASSQLTVASDVHGWNVSPDGAQWFWLSAIDKTGVGMLQTAPFPDGASPSDVQANVIDYGVAPTGGKTVVTISQLGELAAIADPVAAPSAQLALDSQVQKLLSFTDKGHVAYIKHFVGTTLSDLFVANLDGAGVCAVDTTTNVPFVSLHFSPNSESAIWALAKGESFDGLHTRLSDCSTTSLAPDVAALGWIDQETVLFMDDFDADTGRGSIRFRNLAGGQLLEPATPTLVANHADTYAISGPEPGALLYTVNSGGDADGVYVRGFGP